VILALVEHDRGAAESTSLEVLTLGRRLAERLDAPLHAVLIGPSAEPLAEGLARHGVAAAHVADHEGLDDYAPEAWAQSLVELMGALGPHIVMAAGTDRGHEVMAHVAARSGLPMAANCTDIQPGDPFVVTRQRWGGTLLEEARLGGDVKLLTVALHVVPAGEVEVAGQMAVERFTPALGDEDFRVRVREKLERAAGSVALTDARVVVGGGRGVGAEGFRDLEELAGLLGGAVGCSRAVTSAGWRPHSDQIGQTGLRIAPDLYIACGISGATQHIVGCKGAKRILAINTDAEAPILAQADYAVIGDARQIVPAIVAELKGTDPGGKGDQAGWPDDRPPW
jgi:electron transfer flavoprotein alpha subunit